MIVTLSKGLEAGLESAFGDKFQPMKSTLVSKQIQLSPDESQIDLVVFKVSDLGSLSGSKGIINAIQSSHSDVIILGLDDNAKEAARKKIPSVPNIIITPYKKSDDLGEVVSAAYNKVYSANPDKDSISMDDELESQVASFGDMEEESNNEGLNNEISDNNNIETDFNNESDVFNNDDWNFEANESFDETPVDNNANSSSGATLSEEELMALTSPGNANMATNITTPLAQTISSGVEPDFFNAQPEVEAEQVQHYTSTPTIQDQISEVTSFKTLEELAKDLNKNKLYSELLKNSTVFQDVTEKLKIVDKQIMEIHRNPDLTASQRMKEIQRVCDEKASLKGESNALVTEYLCNIIDNVASAATVHMDKEIQNMRGRIASLSERELYKGNTEVVSTLIEERYKLQLELANHISSLNKLCGFLTDLTLDTEETFIEGIPTKNPYLNQFLTPVNRTQPLDLAKHINALFTALQEKSIGFSVIEANLRALMETTTKLVEISDDIIAVQHDLIESMRVQKFEEIVIVQSILKNSLRVYAGGKNSGKSASLAVISELHTRKGDTMIIDLTDNNSLSTYINDMSKLEDVLSNGEITAYDHLYCKTPLALDFNDFIKFLTENTQKYRYIDVLIDNVEVYRKLQEETLAVTVFMQPNISSINDAKRFIEGITIQNIAKQICVVNPAVDPTEMFDLLDISPSEYKYACVPNLPEMSKCALRRHNPGQVKEIRTVFEEEFSC